jgi:CHAT domain-containing protein/tetratricopeptide (TPR) repeat protein
LLRILLFLSLSAVIWLGTLSLPSFSVRLVSAQRTVAPPCKLVHEKDKTIPLEKLKPILTGMEGGETHRYSIKLKPGQFLHVVVKQEGIDVELLLTDQADTKVVPYGDKQVVDSPNGTRGQEFISFIKDKAGSEETYYLYVKSPDKTAPIGCYEVVVEELRDAIPQDNDLIFAEDKFLDGFALRSQDDEEQMLKATAIYEAALSRLESSRNPYLQAELLNELGYAYHFIGNERNAPDYIRKALDRYSRASLMWPALDDRLNEAVCLNGIGNALDWMNRKPEALGYYLRALKIWEDDKTDLGAWATALMNIAFIYDILGDKEEAITYYKQARPLFQRVGNTGKLIIVLEKIGFAYYYLGDYESAIDPLLESLSIAQTANPRNRRGEAGTLKYLGIIYSAMGDQKRSLQYLNQALPIYEELKEVRGQADTINSIGAVSAYSGATEADLQEALKLLERAKRLYDNVHDPDPSDQAATLNNIGSIHYLLKDYQKAIENYNSALRLVRLGISRHTHYASVDRGSEAKTLYNIARAELGRGDLPAARTKIEEAVNIIQFTRTNIRSQELRVSYLASVKFYYEFYIEVLMQLYDQHPSEALKRKAFEVSERARARSLLDMLVGTSQVKTNDPRYRALTRPPSLTEIQRSLGQDTLLLEFSLGDKRSFLWAVTSDSLDRYVLSTRADIEQAVDEFYSRLTARNLHIDYEEKNDRDARIAKADRELPKVAADLSRILLREVAPRLGKKPLLIVADGRLNYVPFAALPSPPTAALSGETGPYFGGGRTAPLIARHQIVNAPSASVLAIIRRRAALRKPALKAAAVLADPVFDKDDERLKGESAATQSSSNPCDQFFAARVESERENRKARSSDAPDEKERLDRLPLTRCEAKRVVEHAPVGSSLTALDFDANGSLVRSGKLSQYRIVHFATHSRINNVRPDLSAIILSRVDKQGNPRPDAYVRARDIYSLNFPADLVVLSSCKTGLGKNVEGEGLVGMTRGFIYAGASRVVVSLWDVNDTATTHLMSEFYQGMFAGRLPAAEALRNAQLSMLRGDPNTPPYFWAAFVLQGEWR